MSPLHYLDEMTQLIHTWPRNLTVLIVEHEMDAIFTLAACVYAMSKGRIVFEGTAQALKEQKQIMHQYLGI